MALVAKHRRFTNEQFNDLTPCSPFFPDQFCGKTVVEFAHDLLQCAAQRRELLYLETHQGWQGSVIALALDGEDEMGQADTKGILETRREIWCTKAVE
jgi:hypothetical protein